jgi:uncharacterized protein YjbI with pentapeptide repeats
MANPDHVALVQRGVDVWNEWRRANPSLTPDLSDAELPGLKLAGINFEGATLERANFSECFLREVNLRGARCASAVFREASLVYGFGEDADFTGAVLEQAWLVGGRWQRAKFARVGAIGINLQQAGLQSADFTEFFTHGGSFTIADATGADFSKSYVAWCGMYDARFTGANFAGGDFEGSDFHNSDLSGARMTGVNLKGANFRMSNLHRADLQGSDLSNAVFVGTDITGADLSNCRIHGVSSWDLRADASTRQLDMIITPPDAAAVMVEDIEVAQFVYLLLNNRKIRNVIDTVGSKGVLILGRFTERKDVLEAIRASVRRRGYVPIVFDFERPTDRDFSETVRVLAGMSRFVIADITRPRSVPLEAQAIVPEYMIPFVPIIATGEQPFSMFQDLWQKHGEWVLQPLVYESIEQLVKVFDKAVIDPANERLLVLRKQKSATVALRQASDYE